MAFKALTKGVERTFAVVGLVSAVTISASVYKLKRFREVSAAKLQELPGAFILELDFEGLEVVEKAAPTWAKFGSSVPQLELRKIVSLLQEASNDTRVKGMLASMGASQSFGGIAQVQEIRKAVESFLHKTQGRVAAVAYADSFGEAGRQGTIPYYLALAFDKVYMQPSGTLSMTGLALTVPFVKRLLEKLSVKATFFTRERYKNVANQFTHDRFSEEHKEASEAILQGFMGQIVEGIASSRRLDKQQVREAVDKAPLLVEQAVDCKLLDGAKYRDEVLASLPRAPDKPNEDLPRVSAVRYARALEAKQNADAKPWVPDAVGGLFEDQELGNDQQRASSSSKPTVALITATGIIVAGKGPQRVVQGDKAIASGQLCDTLRKAREDASVKAVVLRIDSPGGSAVASDSIYREVLRTKESGKPIIVSMGNVSASGGYYISAPATKIVASPGTITGSIGVAFAKFNVDSLLRNVGVDVESLLCGKNAAAMLPVNELTNEQEEIVNRITDNVYQGFLTKVAAGRNKTLEEVQRVAQGRVWTGEAAMAHGLVDKLGGLQDAILLAKQEAGLPVEDEAAVDIKEFPKQRPAFIQLLQRLRGSGPDAAFLIGEVQEMPHRWILALMAGALMYGPSGIAALDETAITKLLASRAGGPQQSGLQLMACPITTGEIL